MALIGESRRVAFLLKYKPSSKQWGWGGGIFKKEEAKAHPGGSNISEPLA